MNARFVCAFAGSLVVSSLAYGYELTSHEISLVHSGFTGAAKFGDLKAAETDGNVLVCGKVNAKNQYGQYMGETLFAGALMGKGDDAATFVILDDGTNPTSATANELLCRQHGISF
ncbi:hypothetical protein [Rhizobium rhizogenes]|uniref:hypothetical protein n=1 Tax=Rhizobium rhizogenes TaxID=359 RepID=UPI001571E6FE|nr:hypothetical protein [Rhizobium rhizogenes]NTG07114.1 hypothetical protein [Rhizobium rhizogenes]